MVPHPPPRRIENPRGWIADRLALMGRNLRLEVPKGSSAQVTHSGGGIEGPEGERGPRGSIPLQLERM